MAAMLENILLDITPVVCPILAKFCTKTLKYVRYDGWIPTISNFENSRWRMDLPWNVMNADATTLWVGAYRLDHRGDHLFLLVTRLLTRCCCRRDCNLSVKASLHKDVFY